MPIIKSRAAQLQDIVPWAPKRCPNCLNRVGTHFHVVYGGSADNPTLIDGHLEVIGWQCGRCGAEHLDPQQPA